MSQLKLFGNTRSGSRLAKNRRHLQDGSGAAVGTAASHQKKKRRNPLKVTAIVLACLLACEVLYFTAVYSKNSFITKWRTIYIETAMDTFTHQWLATAFIPPNVINEVMSIRQEQLDELVGKESSWGKAEDESPEEVEETQKGPQEIETDVTVVSDKDAEEAKDKDSFYEMFYELDVASMEAYVEKHPEVLDKGWSQLKINEAGLDDEGTDIQTIHGEQVLAIDVPNQILLIRVKDDNYMGVLAIAKDPARLSVRAASTIGSHGRTAGEIAQENNGVLAITANGFSDPGGGGNGGTIMGYTMCSGKEYGNHSTLAGYKRIELHEDNLFYIRDASAAVSEKTTDAVEFVPAMIIDGEVLSINHSYNGIQPRACIGQNDKYEIMMLIIEGRLPLRSLGSQLIDAAEILEMHGCMQAMNVDGGTSAIMWYDGEPVTKCSNPALEEGRFLPNAFVYGKAPVE